MTTSLSQSLAGGSPDLWALDFLAAAHFRPTPENVRAVVSWEYAESAGGGGMWNPLNTTQGGYAGETDFNTVGVKNYARRSDGVAANARVIHNGYYEAAVAQFVLGSNARAICDAITASPWGTGYITLRGAQPVPPAVTKGEPMIIASPHKPTAHGRVAAARWNPDTPNVVVCTNGASIQHDVPAPDHRRMWRPPVTTGAHGVGIAPTIGADGRPDGKGIILQDSADGTFIGLWS